MSSPFEMAFGQRGREERGRREYHVFVLLVLSLPPTSLLEVPLGRDRWRDSEAGREAESES